jgi:hypothetical protein
MQKPRAWAVGARLTKRKRADFSALDNAIVVPESHGIVGVIDVIKLNGFIASGPQALGSSGVDVAALNVLDVFHCFDLLCFSFCLYYSIDQTICQVFFLFFF